MFKTEIYALKKKQQQPYPTFKELYKVLQTALNAHLSDSLLNTVTYT